MSKFSRASSSKRYSNASIRHDRRFIINEDTPFSITEEYKTLRTNIMFSIPSDGCKVIGIASAEPMEGKSTNCLNLAITFAQTNKRVLIIDCDLRLPWLATLMTKEAIPGISNVLVGMSSIEEAVKKTSYPGLDAILSGEIPPNPSELLGSDSMRRTIGELSRNYDYIFIDLPPINIVADAAIMSKNLSGLVIVVRAETSKSDNLKKAIGHLDLVNANIIGIILNGVKAKSGFHGKRSKYGRYGKYEYRHVEAKETFDFQNLDNFQQ